MPTYTPVEIVNNFNDYADWEEEASVSRAKSFITWANRLLALPDEIRREQTTMGSDKSVILDLIKSARIFIANSADTSNQNGVSFFSVENFRG